MSHAHHRVNPRAYRLPRWRASMMMSWRLMTIRPSFLLIPHGIHSPPPLPCLLRSWHRYSFRPSSSCITNQQFLLSPYSVPTFPICWVSAVSQPNMPHSRPSSLIFTYTNPVHSTVQSLLLGLLSKNWPTEPKSSKPSSIGSPTAPHSTTSFPAPSVSILILLSSPHPPFQADMEWK